MLRPSEYTEGVLKISESRSVLKITDEIRP